jgi:hypothetical protein
VRRSTSLRSAARSSTAPPSSTSRQNPKAKEAPAPAPAPAPEANLLDLLDDDNTSSVPAFSTNKALPAVKASSNDGTVRFVLAESPR